MISLERLESRTVLSNVFVTPSAFGALAIRGDITGGSFSITENVNGSVTIAPTAKTTLINGAPGSYTTPSRVSSIMVTLPGLMTVDTVSLNGPGKNAPTPIADVSITAYGPTLNFTADGVNNSGSFVLKDIPGYGPASHAALSAIVKNCTFSGGISITQTGDATTSVELDNDSTAGVHPVLGPVAVSEGIGNNNKIILNTANDQGDTFGVTKLTQGVGSGPLGGLGGAGGAGDSVVVGNASVTSLDVNQGVATPPLPWLPPISLGGAKNTINVATVSVAQNNMGISTVQGDGAGDITTITGVTAAAPLTSMLLTPGITVNQGGGAGDSASVLQSTLPGSISITQTDAAGGQGDSATISGDAVGATLPFGSQIFDLAGNLSISQGESDGDTALIIQSSATGNISIMQGNGGRAAIAGGNHPGDSATITGVQAGIELQDYPYFAGGTIAIIQGMGSGDSASLLNSTAVYNVFITQNGVAGNPQGNSVTIEGVTAGLKLPFFLVDYGNIVVRQGNAADNTQTIETSTAVGKIDCC